MSSQDEQNVEPERDSPADMSAAVREIIGDATSVAEDLQQPAQPARETTRGQSVTTVSCGRAISNAPPAKTTNPRTVNSFVYTQPVILRAQNIMLQRDNDAPEIPPGYVVQRGQVTDLVERVDHRSNAFL